ncbi:wax ester/triacylglycerol synthase family O-acyltransferase [Aquabacterium sp.]|uniref:wax ester/triacylglycerol synthase family O-acyltransferase n=1 Tax=Aquabacterium sp. TaxID=1872578 RepID=UPI003784DD7E
MTRTRRAEDNAKAAPQVPDEPMSPTDAAWLHMDGRVNPAIVNGMLLTRQPLDIARVREVCRRRLLGFERFRQRVVETGLAVPTPHWRTVPVDLDHHLRHVALPPPHDAAALRRLASALASTPLDPDAPLWQWTLVDRVGRGSALIMRYHHCIGDGSAMMAVAQKLFDAEPQAVAPAGSAAAAAVPVPAAPQAGRPLVDEALATLGQVASGIGALVGDLLKTDDPRSPLKGEFGMRQRVSWSRPLSLRAIKAVAAQADAKVNDVLVAALAGALREYVQQRGVDIARQSLRAMVPVDLRPPERRGQLGNEFGLVILDLPVGEARRARRLAEAKARMDQLKQSTEAGAMRVLLTLFGHGPKLLQDMASALFGAKVSLVMTNVVGPREPHRFAGVPLDRVVFWVPHPGDDMGMGVSILSYAGRVSLGVMTDARLVPDPEHLTTLFEREFAALLREARR